MHAMIVTVKFEKGRRAEQVSALRERIVPQVRQAPGFVAGYWALDDAAGKGHSFAVFETLEAANQMIAGMKSNLAGPNPGVELEFVTTGIIEAEARVK
jgi:hypothetical protein